MKKLSLLVLTLCLPALAQDSHFHAALSGQFGNFTGLNGVLAVTDYNSATSTYGGPTYTYDVKSKTPIQLDLGITSGDNDYTLSYWGGKAKGDGAFVSPNTSNTYYSPYSDYLSSIGHDQGNTEVKAHTLDITWNRTFVKNDKGSLAFSLGLREFKIEQNTFIDQWDTTTPTNLHMGYDQVDASTKGVGLTVGLNGRFDFSDRMWLTGGVKLAMVDAKSDFHYTGGYYPSYSTPYVYSEIQDNGQKQTSTQMDAELKLNFNFVAGFDGFVGYRMKSFGEALGSSNFSGYYNYNAWTNFTPRTLGFNGIIVGVAYRF